MLTAASAVRTLPPAAPPLPRESGDAAASYAPDWRSPIPPASAPTAPATPLSAAADTRRARQAALLAADVYNDRAAPPAGFRVAGQDDLDRLNLTPALLEQPGSSFRARVYVTGEGADTRYVVAFRGSQSGEDWKNNFEQGVGLDSDSYNKALAIGRRLARSDEQVSLAGHSLGGGLASAAALASGRPGDTFNAAGLHDDTIGAARRIAADAGRGSAAVEAWRVPGEVLTAAQEGSDGWLWGHADLPNAYGVARDLPNVVPDGRNWFEARNPIDRHSIDWVLAGAAALR